jgi:transcriptional regulator with XRE-family HTH domain
VAQEATASPHDTLTTGERLRLLRKRRGLTLRQLAVQTGVSDTSLSEYESDRRQASAEAIRALAIALETSADYLLRLKPTPSKLSGKRTSANRGMPTAKRPIADDLPRQAPLVQVVK